jgi:tetratricopeptide (TPR) repeat protein
MKKSLVNLALAFAIAAVALSATLPACAQSAPSGQQTGPTIKDSAEYNAYVTATNQADPKAQAEAYEAFLRQYPNSVVKVSALEQLIAAYQKINDIPKLQDAAGRLLQADPVNLKALALLTYSNRMCAAQGGPNAMQCLNDAGKYGQLGVQALQTAQAPAGTTPEDWNKLKQQTAPIFNGAVGLQELQAKNYPQAAEALSVAVAANPNDLQNVYPLALAYLSQKPIDPKGLFWIAKAVTLAQGNAQISAFGKSAYTKYHGGDDGWQGLVQQAASQQNIPPDFKVPPAPTPAEQAAKLADTTAVKDMTFDQFELIFTSGNQAAADKVWGQIKGKPIQFEAKVIRAEKYKLMLASTYDDIQNNVADVELTFPVAIPAVLTPKAGEMAKVQGNPATFDAKPFMIHMTEGAFIGKRAPATPAKKSPTKAAPRKRK